MIAYDGDWGCDGFRYHRAGGKKALIVRHAPFWWAFWNLGLSTALSPVGERPLVGRQWFAWALLGEYRGMSGMLAWEGPLTPVGVAEIANSFCKKAEAE